MKTIKCKLNKLTYAIQETICRVFCKRYVNTLCESYYYDGVEDADNNNVRFTKFFD